MTKAKGSVFYNEEGWKQIQKYVLDNDVRNVFVVTDENVEFHCLSYFMAKTSAHPVYEVIRIPSGEAHKNINTALFVWETLANKGADRKSLIINLGGGMVTDLGGFVASTFKRGIPFIHIPTSLLAMVDAAIGGKNGIDLHHIKNQIGTIQLPEMILIDDHFLFSLPKEQLLSGMAEVIKHALIEGEEEWKRISMIHSDNLQAVFDYIPDSIKVKQNVVLVDPEEKHERKILNYGHTLGHAIEAFRLKSGEPLLHGEAVAIGMILETFISQKRFGFSPNILENITQYIISLFPKQHFETEDVVEIMKLTAFDKKNINGEVRFVLMENFGKFHPDCTVESGIITDAFSYYSMF